MPIDKPKHPDHFPALFRYPLERGQGEYFLAHGTERECRSTARKYRCYLKSLAVYPLHPMTQAAQHLTIRTRMKQVRSGLWNLFVVVNGKFQFPEPETEN